MSVILQVSARVLNGGDQTTIVDAGRRRCVPYVALPASAETAVDELSGAGVELARALDEIRTEALDQLTVVIEQFRAAAGDA